MNLLLDTHALLWWLGDPGALSARARAAITDPENTVFLSAVVVWEIRIKEALGKLTLPAEFRAVLAEQPFSELSVTVEHAHLVASLPPLHHDPFDRLLIAQALCERHTIVTRDDTIAAYAVPTLAA